jgi:hypothetical protein
MTESTWEGLAMDELAQLAWGVKAGKDLAPGTGHRRDWDDLILYDELQAAIERLNPELSGTGTGTNAATATATGTGTCAGAATAVHEAMRIATDPASREAYPENRQAHEYLTAGIRLTYTDEFGAEQTPTVRLVDFTDVDANSYLAVNACDVPEVRQDLARGGPVETTKDPASTMDRWRRSSSSKSPSTAQNLSASLGSGARYWGTSYRRHRRGLPLGAISSARSHLSSGIHGSPAVIPQVWARECTSSAFPKARSSRIGCILTCGSAPGSWVKSAWPHLRPSVHDWSRSARYACDYCLPMTKTSRAS